MRRWRQLTLPVVYENAHDPGFTDKVNAIKDRWRATVRPSPVGSAG